MRAPRRRSRALAATLVLLAAALPDAPVLAQSVPAELHPEATSADPSPERRPWLAVGEALFVNVLVNRFDAWVLKHDWARVGPADWSRNLRLGWEWDEDEFATNMFAHPYHGALYFNAGRTHGLSYWESVPLTLLGSFTWEYFGETYRPSLNDFLMTSFGGIALGEVLHRTASSVRRADTGGRERLLRELLAFPLDPVGGMNRLVSGEATRRSESPPAAERERWLLRLSGGARLGSDELLEADRVEGSPTIVADLSFGDPVRDPYRAPFDAVSIRAQLSPDGGGLNLLRVTGRLYAQRLGARTGRYRHVLTIDQRYEYISNPAQRFGAQSAEVGVRSRWDVGRGVALLGRASLDVILLGAVDAPFAGTAERTYDFGSGGGFRTEFALERGNGLRVTTYARTEYVHTVSGTGADHNLHLGGTELDIPIAWNMGVGAQLTYFNRASRYTDRPDQVRDFSELRVFLVWTASGAPPPPGR